MFAIIPSLCWETHYQISQIRCTGNEKHGPMSLIGVVLLCAQVCMVLDPGNAVHVSTRSRYKETECWATPGPASDVRCPVSCEYTSFKMWRRWTVSAFVWMLTCECVCFFSLKTVEGKVLCARSSVSWVTDLIRHLDAKVARAGETSNL